jgi:putative membrane-bound dehydrogenase-like protein
MVTRLANHVWKLTMKKTLLFVALCSLASCPAAAQETGNVWGPAVWVWDQPHADRTSQGNEPRYLRRVFEVSGKPVKADLWITADNHYVVYVNGKRVGSDGEWSTIEKYDVLKHLVPGKNVLAIEARNDGGPAGVIARLWVRTADNKTILAPTDRRTRIHLLAGKDWQKADFDDSRWPLAVVLGGPGMEPWNLQGGANVVGGGDQPNVSAVDATVQKQQPPEKQHKHFTFPKGFELELVAAEPLVINPVTMTLDEQGRIYVSESHTYRYGPAGSPVKPYANPIVRLDPQPGGSLKRTLVADGFEDPAMGLAIRDGKLWVTANNFLYLYDLTPAGKAVNKRTLLVDKNKAWNPFGMFVLEFGPDGWLYMSVGDHRIDIHGPTNKISGRGNSGIIVRMKPDGSEMERLVHGLRVPYSFEYDPFGQLWLLSNGEGNPDRFVRVIEGVDYHCYSRGNVDNNWLAGNHPLAPPCFQNMRGAHTQLLRYYAAAYPEAYRGSLFCDNWGAHGFAGPNRAIFRFHPDGRNNIAIKEPFLGCTDPHFRPSHIVLDHDGNLLIADWYGRDDESDLTGRIWRLKYTGADKPAVMHELNCPKWRQTDYAVSALGSPDHLIREKAARELIKRGTAVVPDLAAYAENAKESLGAAHALWVLLRMNTPDARSAIVNGGKHPDWRVRRLALNIMRRFHLSGTEELARSLGRDGDPAVRLEAAKSRSRPADACAALIDALTHGAAADAHLRYEAGWHLAKVAETNTFATLFASDDEGVRLAGLIAIDVACHENFPPKTTALATLAKALENPGKLDLGLLLDLAQMHGDRSVFPALEKLLVRNDLPAATTARALLVLKSRAGSLSEQVAAAAGKRLVAAVEKGNVRLATPNEQLIFLEFLESEGPTPFALQHIGREIVAGHPAVRPAAHGLARRFGAKGAPLANMLWPNILKSRSRHEDTIETISTIARIDAPPDHSNWERLLGDADPLVRTEAVRWWRQFKGRPQMVDILARHAPELVKKDGGLKEDLAAVFRSLETTVDAVQGIEPISDKTILTKETLAAIAALPPKARDNRALLGRQVFDRAGCVKCHTTATQTTLLAPSLKGIAAQKVDYLIESVLYPSKIIKTGFESETIVTKDGKTLNGLVKDEGKVLRILNLDKDIRVAKADVDERLRQNVSIMPEGQEALMGRREFVDLIAYLMTLR